MMRSTISSGVSQCGERIIRDPTPLYGRHDSNGREASPRNKLDRHKARTDTNHALESRGCWRDNKGQETMPFNDYFVLDDKSLGSTTTIPTLMAPSMPIPAKFPPPHLPNPRGATGNSPDRPFLGNKNDAICGRMSRPKALSPKVLAVNKLKFRIRGRQNGTSGHGQASTNIHQ